ncbi:MAG: co-chaperone GroES [Myxococcota bacterium]
MMAEDDVPEDTTDDRAISTEDVVVAKRSPLASPERVSRHVMPMGPRVLVRVIRSTDRSAGGLYLPAGAKDAIAQAAYGEVVEVARASAEDPDEGFGKNVSGIPEGAKILFSKDRGLPVPWDDDLRILDVKDVVATVEEIELNRAN